MLTFSHPSNWFVTDRHLSRWLSHTRNTLAKRGSCTLKMRPGDGTIRLFLLVDNPIQLVVQLEPKLIVVADPAATKDPDTALAREMFVRLFRNSGGVHWSWVNARPL